MPGFDHTRRGRGDVCLPKSVRVIACAVDFGQASTLIEVGGQWADLG
jgi:hypothetical protein